MGGALMTYAQRRDANESRLIELMRGMGAHVIMMDKSAGFDLLVTFRGVHYMMEIKEVGKYTLTKRERDTCTLVELAGGAYNIIQADADVLAALGVA